MNTKTYILLAFVLLSGFPMIAQKATVTEKQTLMKTYPFGDPDPVAKPDNLYYPYFRFDGFAEKGEMKNWKTVELENDYIKVTLFPEIGGKVWGAVEKSTGKEFIYYNHVVKFRDIAMRGPWVSGGVEFNFGIIGHAPTSSTPVDYITKTKKDGSVSCYLSAIDFVTRTTWTVEVNLPKDKAYFTTNTTWHNGSSLDQPYYQWMNAGYKASGDIQFCYPGMNYIGHDGERNTFPIDEKGRDISWYKNNNFESSKSYHVLGHYNDFYGAYWHEDDFGSVHHANHDAKLGMKIFLWSQAQDGAIWEDLLTDTDGQYVELQSGRVYNQPATNSAFTPFKHPSFTPQGTDKWTEFWYPVKGIKGITKASKIGALNLIRDGKDVIVNFSPVQNGATTLRIFDGEKEVASRSITMEAMKPWSEKLSLANVSPDAKLKIVIGENELVYSEEVKDQQVSRPQTLPENFDWNSVYGLYTKGEQWMNIKMFDRAEADLRACLAKDANFAPALVRLASLMNHLGRYDEALELSAHALSLNTYDGEANYVYGLVNKNLGRITDAKDGFSVASYSGEFRSAAYAQLAGLFIAEKDYVKGVNYANKSLEFNSGNMDALQELLVCLRKTNKKAEAEVLASGILENTPLNHIVRYEMYAIQPTEAGKADFVSLIRNELPQETYMELAILYQGIGCLEEALELASFAKGYPVADYTQAYLLNLKGQKDKSLALLKEANAASPKMVFPFRPETLKVLDWAAVTLPSWKVNYYKALVYYANRDKMKALELLDKCDEADYSPLFLTRALLKQGDGRLADLQKAERLESGWRCGVALINYYMTANDWKQANLVAAKYHKMYPSNYVIGLKYGRTLCETGKYDASIDLLKKVKVLPNEGAYAGRGVYRDANLYQAISAIGTKKYARALKFVADSKIWIENLGVGKPYDDQIDYRLETFIESMAFVKDKAKEESLLNSIAGIRKSSAKSFESANLLTAIALRKLGKKAESDKLVDQWNEMFPNNQVVKWCTAVYNKDLAKANDLVKSRNNHDESTPWEETSVDRNFDLMIKLTDFLAKEEAW